MAKLELLLRDITYNYNHSHSTAHGKIPAEVNHPKFDPELRLALYGPNVKLQPFESFYHEALTREKAANTPRTKNQPKNIAEHENEYKKNDLVYVDAVEPKVGGRYHVRRRATYRIHSVNTVQKPYLYRLQDIESKKLLNGFYYGRELLAADLVENLQVDHVLKRRRRKKDGKSIINVKFKGHDDTFNRWQEE